VNWQHLQAFLWLRWRLLVNQMRRGGPANVVLVTILAVAITLFSAILFLTFFLIGLFALGRVWPEVILYVFDGLVVAFLFAWTLGLLMELQRSEVLSLEKFLHLPVSVAGVFLLNYLSSLFSLSLLAFLPAMLGLALALVFSKGPAMLMVFPLLAAFVLMVTAVTYQFQGWLASLMVNKRRRRTIIVVVTAAFILLCQLPNLVNLFTHWDNQRETELLRHRNDELAELERAHNAGEIKSDAYQKRAGEIRQEYQKQLDATTEETLDYAVKVTRLVNVALPPGWLPLGAVNAAEGNVVPALLGTLGMTLIGGVSLWRSYRTTLRLYTGQFNAGKKAAVPVPVPIATGAKAGKPSVALLERQVPYLSEPAAAVALGGFRSLTRAPEAKMMLLTPLVLLVIFGSMALSHSVTPPEFVRPMITFGAMSTILLSMGQLVGNQFGLDRTGFRVFVLSGAPRREILLGKNMATAPLAMTLSVIVIVVVEVFYRLRPEHFLAALPQFVSMYLLFCLLANCLSIFAPMPIRAGTMKPMNPKLIPVLLHVFFSLLFPFVLAPALLPLGVEFLVESLTTISWVPVCLILSVIECVGVILLYRLVLTWQGRLLLAREQRILETVTTKAE
jgi:ABC-2 type transport system permease protein